jgi:hypothetical protein
VYSRVKIVKCVLTSCSVASCFCLNLDDDQNYYYEIKKIMKEIENHFLKITIAAAHQEDILFKLHKMANCNILINFLY